MKSKISRRSFLRNIAAAGSGAAALGLLCLLYTSHVSRPDFGMAQPDPAHPLTEFYLLVQQALDKAGCFALPALYASLQAPCLLYTSKAAGEHGQYPQKAGQPPRQQPLYPQ